MLKPVYIYTSKIYKYFFKELKEIDFLLLMAYDVEIRYNSFTYIYNLTNSIINYKKN